MDADKINPKSLNAKDTDDTVEDAKSMKATLPILHRSCDSLAVLASSAANGVLPFDRRLSASIGG